MIKTVLVPTDFSKNAFVAAQFAATLSLLRGWQMEICHVFRPFYSGFQGEKQNKEDEVQARNEACERMNGFVEKIQIQHPALKINGTCLIGHEEDEIVAEAEKNKAVLIIMGTKGATGAKYSLLGSTTFNVIQHATVPVLAIPKTVKKFQLNRIGFTTNYHSVEIGALHDFIALLGNQVQIIPFHLYMADRPRQEEKMMAWKTKTSEMLASHTLKFRLMRARSHMGGIRSIIKKEKLDAIAMTRFKKDFFTRLIGRDLIKAVVHQCSVPVLVFPQD